VFGCQFGGLKLTRSIFLMMQGLWWSTCTLTLPFPNTTKLLKGCLWYCGGEVHILVF
jgi:hypothetical protein